MKVPLATRIAITIGDINIGEPVVMMSFGQDQYVMLAAKRNLTAAGLIEELSKHFGVDAITGIAFHYWETMLGDGNLIMSPDPSATGIYVKTADFPKVRELFNK